MLYYTYTEKNGGTLMPELPEVETIKNVLAPHLCGRKIIKAALIRPEVAAHPTPEEF